MPLTYAVGDIHGSLHKLRRLIGRCEAHAKGRHATFIFLGDYIDRGPDSRSVIDLLIARRRRHEMFLLKGNHEVYALEVLNDPSVLPEWIQIGGVTTLLSYGVKFSGRTDPKLVQDAAIAFRHAMPESHHRFIEELALSFTCGDFFFTHAGVRPGIPLPKQAQQDLLWIRDEFLLHEDDFGKVVVHGHTPAMEPDIRPNRINIDTGAYATGRLTCLVLEGDQMRFL